MTQRTFHQLALGFGTIPCEVTVSLDGNIIYQGAVATLDEPIPLLPNPDYDISNQAWSWQLPADFAGTADLSITVSGSTLYLAQTLADNPYQYVPDPASRYQIFFNIEVDGVSYSDPFTDEAIDGIPLSGPYRPDEPGQWWWAIPPGSVFTSVLHVDPPKKPYVIFDSAPQTVTAGDSASFQVSIPQVNPARPLPQTFAWQIVNGTSISADFVSTSGNVPFITTTSTFQIDTVAPAVPQGDRNFRVEILQPTSGNAIVSSHMITITS